MDFHGYNLQRHAEIELLDVLQQFPAVGIVGPRQVGKTTLAKKLADSLDKEVIYLDLENPRDLVKLEDPVLFFEGNQHKCIILDEIQLKSELFPILRSMIDAHRVPARFILLGSASPELMRETSESLAGRIFYQELTPIGLMEIEDKFSMTQHWLKGGFPEALILNEPMSARWKSSFIKTYIERDLPILGLDVSRTQLFRFWQMLGHLHGQLLNYDALAKSLGLTGPTVKRYVHFLKEAFLTRLLEPYFPNTKKRLVKSPKVYIRDSGLYHNLNRIENYDDLLGFPFVGHSWEAYVVEQIAQNLKNDQEIFFYRTHQGAELDIVITQGFKPIIGIDVKFSSSPKVGRGMHNSMEDLGLTKAFLITPDTDNYAYSKNIEVINLKDFLVRFNG